MYRRVEFRLNWLPNFILLLGISITIGVSIAVAGTSAPKGHQATGDIQTDTVALLGRFGELIARERAYKETIYEMYRNTRGESPFKVDDSTLDAVLGDNLLELYDEVLPKLEALGQKSRRIQIALRFDRKVQENLIAGERVEGINKGAVNNVIAHYKIAIEKIDISTRQLLLTESLLLRRAADTLAQALNQSGDVVDYVSYVRASHLLAMPRQVKGFSQPRCNIEGDALKQSRTIRNNVSDRFFFDENMKFQSSVQALYDAAGLVEAQALLLNQNGSHCK
ncbi:MAG: hypothetical protein V3U65_06520 [Granulosicoccaceae bacterium]